MNPKNQPPEPTPPALGTSLMSTLENSPLDEALANIAELPIDSILSSGAFRDLPVIGTITALWKTGTTVRDWFLVQKLLRFLLVFEQVPLNERQTLISRLSSDRDFRREVGEKLVIALDRLDNAAKASFLAKAFLAYCRGHISRKLFLRISLVIDRLLFEDLIVLPTYDMNRGYGWALHQAYVNVGLLYLTHGMATAHFQKDLELWDAILAHVLI